MGKIKLEKCEKQLESEEVETIRYTFLSNLRESVLQGEERKECNRIGAEK